MGARVLGHVRRLDHYGLVLVLLFIGISVTIAAPDGRWKPPAVAALSGIALLLALHISRASRRAKQSAQTLVFLAVVASTVDALVGEPGSAGAAMVVTGVLAAAGPFALVRGVRFQERVDPQTVAAALSIYLLIGQFFAFTAGAANAFGPQYFTQQPDPSSGDFMYFSFITLATVGYGDLSPATDLGQALAVAEALTGQLYLVSIVALVVGNLGRERRSRASDGPPPANEGSVP
jgi:hypothetical protein